MRDINTVTHRGTSGYTSVQKKKEMVPCLKCGREKSRPRCLRSQRERSFDSRSPCLSLHSTGCSPGVGRVQREGSMWGRKRGCSSGGAKRCFVTWTGEGPMAGTGWVRFLVWSQRASTGCVCPVEPEGQILSPGQGGGCWAGNEDMQMRSEDGQVCGRHGLVHRPQA